MKKARRAEGRDNGSSETSSQTIEADAACPVVCVLLASASSHYVDK
jgi:hypothetical protein